MFKIVEKISETLSWPVIVSLPVEGGKTRKFEFTGVFRRLDADEKDAFLKEVSLNNSIDSNTDWVETFIDRISQIMVDWKDVCDEDGKPVAYSRDALRRAVRSPSGGAVMNAINTAISQFESGAKAKN